MKLSLKEIVLFPILGNIMFVSKVLMQALPNIHLIALFIVSFTLVFRVKALIPIYIYVLLEGLFFGFTLWWVPYLYVWAVLWGIIMLLPKNMPKKAAIPIYCAVCGLHGFLFGVLYAPFQAFAFGMNFQATVAWIVAGLPFDLIHGCANMVLGTLVLPIASVLKRFNLQKTA
ncbi:MAG: hypothetical protein KBS41_04225 [Oscillospiraceae bacterium]|nr:hypothetical protein [Candidatus Equicaccousia limihippi]